MRLLAWTLGFFVLATAIAGLGQIDSAGPWVLLGLFLLLGAKLLKRARRAPTGARPTQGRRKRAADPRDDPDYDGYYDDVEIILRTRGIRPPGKWKRRGDWFQVAGVMSHAREAEAFIRGVKAAHDADRDFGLILHREPENPHDENAVAVFGWWSTGAAKPESAKIGYVPREIAARIKHAPAIEGELESVWLKPLSDERDGLAIRMYLLTQRN